MSYRAWMNARQLLTNERFRTLIKEAQRAEDAEFSRAARHAPRG